MKQTADEYLDTLLSLLKNTEVTDQEDGEIPLGEGVKKGVEALVKTREEGSKVMIIGNGGSASIADHIHNDLCKAASVRAMVFHENALITALANDDGYGEVFEKPVLLWAEKGDVLFAISSSGRSENILRAARTAMKKGCRVLTFSGFKPDNPLRLLGSLNFYIASEQYGFVETAHAALAHLLTDMAADKTCDNR